MDDTSITLSVREDNGKTEYDFESLYKIYPRHIGKKLGHRRLRSLIKTNEEFEMFRAAVLNYKRLCELEKREPRYIKHWSSFVNCWEDYVTEEKPAADSQLDRIMRGEV